MGRLAAVCTIILGICLAALLAEAAQRVALAIGTSDYGLKLPEPVMVEEKPRSAEQNVAVVTYPKANRRPGETFQECPECPEMVVVPPGRFTMGSSVDEENRRGFEGPQHEVRIAKAFAVGKYEVTRREFAAFVDDTGYRAGGGCDTLTGTKWRESGPKFWHSPGFSQSDRDPVVCVSWYDANSYLRWIGRKTGVAYRLLSEAEWEYAARAGTRTAYSTGSSILKRQANYGSHDGTVRVGSYPPNAFGLHDVHGNVWEWTEDCWHNSYHGAPGNGGAWTTGNECVKRVLRGGSWRSEPKNLRSANRYGDTSAYRYHNRFGFRVARTL